MSLIVAQQPLNMKHPINESIIGCWAQLPFTYTNARIRDQLNRNHLTVGSGCSMSMLGPTGRAVRFSASNLTLSSDCFKRVNGVGNITVALWIRPTIGGSYMAVFDSANRDLTFMIDTTIAGYVGAGGTSAGMAFSPAFTSGEWQHLIFTYDGTQVKVYRNGVLSGTTTLGNKVFTDNVVFGTNPSTGGTNYVGLQSGWRIWDRTFTAKQCRELYAEARVGYRNTYNYLPNPFTTPAITQFTMPADYGSFTLSGQDVTLTFTPAATYSMAADPGTFTMSGQEVSLLFTPAVSSPDNTASLGRHRRGEKLAIVAVCPAAPTDCPIVDIWLEGTTKIKTFKLPSVESSKTIFALDALLDSEYEDGHYVMSIRYTAETVLHQIFRFFEVMGGSASGTVISIIEMNRLLGKAVISQREDGRISMGYNPRVE